MVMASAKSKSSTPKSGRKSRSKSSKSATVSRALQAKTAKINKENIEAELTALAQEVFSLFDGDSNGHIHKSELGPALRSVGLNPSEKEIETFIRTLLPPGESLIDFRTFLVMTKQVSPEGNTEEEVMEAFEVFDTTASGKIKVDDFKNVMMNLGEKLTEEDVQDMLNFVDYTPKGEIKYRDFIKVMLSDSV